MKRILLILCVSALAAVAVKADTLAVKAGDVAPADGVFMSLADAKAMQDYVAGLERELALAQEGVIHQKNLNKICATNMQGKVDSFTRELAARGEEIKWKDVEIDQWERRWKECEEYAVKLEKRAGGGILNNRTVTFITDAIIMGATAWAWHEVQ